MTYIVLHARITNENDPMYSTVYSAPDGVTNHVRKMIEPADLPSTLERWNSLGRVVEGCSLYTT